MQQSGGLDSEQALKRLIGDCFFVLIPIVALYSYALMRFQALGDGDTGWHVAAGQWIISKGSVPHTDIFSYAMVGREWTAHEWLADVLMAWSYNQAGWSGVLMLYALFMGVLAGVLALYVRRWLEPKVAALVIAAVIVGLFPFFLARPHVTSWPVLAAWTVLLLRAREEDRTPPWWSLLLITLWANLHGSFVFGILLVGPFAAEALFAASAAQRLRVFGQWALFGAGCLLAALINPYGPHGLMFPFQLTAMPILATIEEWMPTSFATIKPFEVVLLAGLGVCLWRGVKLPLWRLLLVLGMLHMAFAHIRHQAVFLIVVSLVLAGPLAQALGKGELRFDLRQAVRDQWREVRPLVLMLGLVALGLTAWRFVVPAQRPDSAHVPVTAMAQLPADLKSQRVFNDYSFGGSLALAGVPVFVDGRADMYGEEHIKTYLDLANAPDERKWQAAMERWQFGWTFLPPDAALAKFLDRQPGWRRVYSDEWAVIHVNEAVRNAPQKGP